MADPAGPSSATPDDEQSVPEPTADGGEFEVEAHLAGPLDLQEMGVKAPASDHVVGSSSATSVALCC